MQTPAGARGAQATSIAVASGRPRRAPTEIRRRRFLIGVADHSVAIFFSVVFLTPFVYILTTTLITKSQTLTESLWPRPFQWSNFAEVFRTMPFWRSTWNTVVYALASTFGVIVSSVPVAYALSRMKWRGRNAVFLLVLATMMLPGQVTIIPLYVRFSQWHLVGTLWPLIIPAFVGDAFSIFLLRQFFLTIPEDLVDAARVDGANQFQIMWHVVVKLAKPAIMAVALFQFLYAWNDFFGPLVYTGNNPNVWTLSVALQQFTTLQRGVLWNLQMAASILFMLPVILVFFLAQKVFIEGVTLTGVKG